jgi:hypothetical protein
VIEPRGERVRAYPHSSVTRLVGGVGATAVKVMVVCTRMQRQSEQQQCSSQEMNRDRATPLSQ